jgi:hypothetical protein
VKYEGNSISKLQIQVVNYVFVLFAVKNVPRQSACGAFFVGKKYGSKGYPQRNADHMGSLSLWISFAASIFFAHKKTHNVALFYRGTCIQGRRHLVTAATSVQSCA